MTNVRTRVRPVELSEDEAEKAAKEWDALVERDSHRTMLAIIRRKPAPFASESEGDGE